MQTFIQKTEEEETTRDTLK